MTRRKFITLFGGAAAAWPIAARGQQATMPVIGFLSSVSEAQTRHMVAAFQRGLGETGYVDGRNVAIDYRFADGQYDRLPAIAGEMVGRQVSLILTAGPPAALAAKVATTTIPIVFIVGLDPVRAGLVTSFNRPGGNLTGMVLILGLLGQKRLELARDLVPKAAVVAMLANPLSPGCPARNPRGAGGRAGRGIAAADAQRQHGGRDRCRVRIVRRTTSRRSAHRRRSVLHDPSRRHCPAGRALRVAGGLPVS